MLDGCFIIFVLILLFFRNIKWKRLIFLLLLACEDDQVNLPIAINLWGHCPFDWVVLPSVGRFGSVVIIGDAQVLGLVGSKIRTYVVCCKLKFLKDNFVWGVIGVYGPNDDILKFVLFDELKHFMSQWDIPWCSGGDFNVVRSYGRSSGG